MKMHVKHLGLTIVMGTLIMLIVAIPLVHGTVDWTLPPNNLSSGYRVTTENFPDPVVLGDPVVAWAGTTNSEIKEVKFRWNPPDGEPFVIVGTYEDTTTLPDDTVVYQWSSTYTPIDPDELGDWGIQGVFYTDPASGHGVGPIPEQELKTAIRARSFFAIPEVPIGTIAVIIAMFGALSVFALKRKHL
jgi:hypothetical protein